MLKSGRLIEKQLLRKFLINRRLELKPVFEAKNNIHIHIQPLLNHIGNEFLGTFISIRDELDTNKLNQYLLKQNINLALPVVDFNNQEIDFFLYDKNTKLVKNKYSILEPESKKKILFPKIILVPLLGYSMNGYRLGYGGGYYDKYISRRSNNDIQKIGIAFSFQEVDKIPTEEHDERLDWILNEKHLYKV